MTLKVPPCVYRGKVQRVHSVNAVEILLDLRFGVHIEKTIVLEGVEPGKIASHLRSDAMKCLIRLIGGKSVIVHADDEPYREGYVLGRIFVTDRVIDPPVPLLRPYNMTESFLEVSSVYLWMASLGYQPDAVSAALDGKAR